MDSLLAVEQAITQSDDFELALSLAIASWQREPRSEMADVVDALTKRCASSLDLLPSRAPKPAYQKAWMALAKTLDPKALPALLEGLAKAVPENKTSILRRHYMRTRLTAYLARVEALAQFPRDPRIAMRLVEVLRASPWSVMEPEGADDVYGSTIALIGELRDVRAAKALEDLLARPTAKRAAIREVFASLIPPVIERLKHGSPEGAAAPVLVALRTRLIGEQQATTPAKNNNEDALLAMVLANPDDREARQVYADALLERGDPHGELMSIQLKAKQTPDDEKRVRSLQRKHDAEWLGNDLARILKLRVYRDGMLDEAELCQAAVADPAAWRRAANDDRLATIRTLHKGSASEALYCQVVFSPAMRGLREVHVASREMLRTMCDSDRPLPFAHLIIDRAIRPQSFLQLDKTKTLPSLTRLTIAVDPHLVSKTLETLCSMTRRFEEIIFNPYRWYRYRLPAKRARLASYKPLELRPLVKRLAPTRVKLPA